MGFHCLIFFKEHIYSIPSIYFSFHIIPTTVGDFDYRYDETYSHLGDRCSTGLGAVRILPD